MGITILVFRWRQVKNLNLKPYLFPLLVLGFIILVSAVFLFPRINDIYRIQRQISSEKETLARLTQKVADLKGIDQVEQSDKVETLVRALPPEKNVPGIIVTLKTIARDLGVEINNLTIGPSEISSEAAKISSLKKSDLNSLDLKLSLSGDADKMKDFFDRVEFVAPLMRVEKISLSVTGELNLTANLNLMAYSLPLPETLGAVESPLPLISKAEEEAFQRISAYQPVALPEDLLPPVQSGKENPFSF